MLSLQHIYNYFKIITTILLLIFCFQSIAQLSYIPSVQAKKFLKENEINLEAVKRRFNTTMKTNYNYIKKGQAITYRYPKIDLEFLTKLEQLKTYYYTTLESKDQFNFYEFIAFVNNIIEKEKQKEFQEKSNNGLYRTQKIIEKHKNYHNIDYSYYNY